MADAAFEKAWAAHESQAFSFMEQVCEIGPRFMGTEGERKVRGFLRRRMEAGGLQGVKAEGMEYLGYGCEIATLRVVSPESCDVPCEGIGLSGLTPEEGTEAQLVFVGEGTKEDYDQLSRNGQSSVGRIVLADVFKSYQAVPLAEEHYAVGFILGTRLEEEAVRVGVTNLSGLPGRIPAVAVSPAQSGKLQSLTRKGPVRVRIDVKGRYEADTSEIIVGDIPGTELPDEVVYVLSHFDSHGLGPHAADNATGTGALLDLAGFFSRARPRRTLRFLGLPAEEFGFLGARSYVSRHWDEVASGKAVVNLDGFHCALPGRLNAQVTEETRTLVERVLSEHEIPVSEWHCPPKAFSDHFEFQKLGVPVAWIYELDDYYHTALDRPANLDRVRFDTNLKALAAMLWEFANG